METRRVSEGYADPCFSLAYVSGFQKCAISKRKSEGYFDACFSSLTGLEFELSLFLLGNGNPTRERGLR